MKIAICIPVHGDTRADFTFSLAEMIIHTLTERPDLSLKTFKTASSNLVLNREELVTRACEWDANWILWLDSDQTFPAETLIRLLSLNEPVIGANYPRRHRDAEPTAGMFDGANGTPVWTTKQKAIDSLIEPVDYMGLGVCLVSMAAVETAEPPLFSGEEAGEDVTFFMRLRAAGFQPKVDHVLSTRVGHMDLRMLTYVDSIQRKNMREVEADLAARRESRSRKE